MEPSWRAKVGRAEHHLEDFKDGIGPIDERHAYPVTEGVESDDQGRSLYVNRIDIPEPDDPLLPIIAGDLLSNLRSALDHLAAAFVSDDERTKSTAFPIFTTDPDETDPTTGNYLHKSDRAKWKAMTKGFPQGTMEVVVRAQPYQLGSQGLDPQYGSLALLRTFQNADKHNRLVVVVAGLHDPTIWFNLSPIGKRRVPLRRIPPDRRLPPRAVVRIADRPLPPDVEMEAEGTVDVMIGDGQSGAYMSCPFVFEAMIRDVNRVLDDLEAFAVHLPPGNAFGAVASSVPASAYTEIDHM